LIRVLRPAHLRQGAVSQPKIGRGATSPEFPLTIRHDRNEWLVETSSFPHDDASKARSAGASFDLAWRALTPLFVEPISPAASHHR